MYFRLSSRLNPNCGRIRPKENVSEMLMDGTPVDESDLTIPWPFSLTVAPEKELLLSAYYGAYNLMSRALVDVMRTAGAGNLQTFDATITNDKTGEVNTDYVVVNILGVVEASDLNKSKTRALADAKFFEQLVIDGNRAKDFLIFRLAESYTDIVVADGIAKAIEANKFQDVTLQPLE